MLTLQLLQEIFAVESYFHSLPSRLSEKEPFLRLIESLANEGKIQESTAKKAAQLWKIRNRLVSQASLPMGTAPEEVRLAVGLIAELGL